MLVKDMYKCTWYGEETTKAQYDEILSMLRNRPSAPEGYGCRLRADLEWEFYELPEPVPEEETATEADYQSALREMGVEV